MELNNKRRVVISFLGILVVVGVVSFTIGHLFSKTGDLEQMAKGHQEILNKLSIAAEGFTSTTFNLEQTIIGHDKILTELSKTAVVLGEVVEGHYITILKTTDVIKSDMTFLRTDMIKKIDLIQGDIDKLRKDINTLILEMGASKSSEAND